MFSVVCWPLDCFVLESVSLSSYSFLTNALFAFLIIDFKSFSCILDTHLLSDTHVDNAVLSICGLLFIVFMVSFEEQSFVSFKSNLVFFNYFFFYGQCLCPVNKFCLFQGCASCFFQGVSQLWILIFRPVVHFESFFVYHVN